MTAFVLLATLLGACAFALLTRRVWWRRGGGRGQPAGAEAAPAPSRQLLSWLAALMLVVAVGGYAWLGSPASLPLTPASTALAARDEGNARQPTAQQIAAMLDQLAARLKDRPDDANGWALLARSYVATGRHAEAVGAFQKVLALRPDDPDLLSDYADVLAVTHRNSLEGEPERLIERALRADPTHLKALALKGTVAFNRKDFAAATQAWEKALQVAPPNHPFAGILRDSIAQARELGAGAANGKASPTGIAREGTAATTPDTNGDTSKVSGTVSLSPALAGRAAPDDTVFVFARAAEGPRMPLAVLRKQVRDLPFEFVLDDSVAMSPTAKLSSTTRLIVGARISKSGTAIGQSGDLQGSVGPVQPGASRLKIEIGEVVAK